MTDETKTTSPEEGVEAPHDPETPAPKDPAVDIPPPEVFEEELPEPPEPDVPGHAEPKPSEEPVSSSEGNAANVNFQIGGMPITFEERQVPLIGLFFGSMIALMSATLTVDEDDRYYSYAVSVGSVGMCTSTLAIAMSLRPRIELKLGRFMAVFNFVWSILGACILTFGPGPYVQTGNGYFSLWLMTICSIRCMGISLRDVKESAYDGSSLLGMGLASLILIIALSFELQTGMPYRANSIYAMIVAILSLIFVERLRDFEATTKSMVLTILVVGWIVSACLVTFEGPFTETGNGFFAAWGGTVSCLFATNDDFLLRSRSWIEENIIGPFKRATGLDSEGSEVSSDSDSNVVAVTGIDLEAARDTFYEDRSTEEMFAVAVDMPGVEQDDVKLTLDGAALTISGLRNPADDGASIRTTITKTIDIDLVLVDTEKFTAVLEKGVLLVSAPKRKKEEIYKTRDIVIT